MNYESKLMFMYFIKKQLVYYMAITLLIACGSQKALYEVRTVNNDNELSKVDKIVDEDNNGLSYSILKKGDYLLIHLTASEKILQMKMLRNGTTIFIDKEGRKDEDFAISYPLKSKEKLNPKDFKGMRGLTLKNVISELAPMILLTENGEERLIDKNLNSEGVDIKCEEVNEALDFIVKIPLKYITSDTETKTIGISIKGMQKSTSSNPGGRSGMNRGMRPGGMSRGSGRMGSRGGQKNMEVLRELQKDINFWIPITIID